MSLGDVGLSTSASSNTHLQERVLRVTPWI